MGKGSRRWYFWKSLVIFQFTVSLIFIVSTLVIYKQNNFVRKKDLGINPVNVMVLFLPWTKDKDKIHFLSQKIAELPFVKKVALQSFSPIGFSGGVIDAKFIGQKEITFPAHIQNGDENFIALYQMKLLSGRNISSGDSLNELVLNYSFSRLIGFDNPMDAIGKLLYISNRPHPIVGVIEDYNESPLYKPIFPVCIGNSADEVRQIAIRFEKKDKYSHDDKTRLTRIQELWKNVYPGQDFDYFFLADSIESFYKKDRQTEVLVNIAMLIAMFISCIGVLGMAIHIARSKKREIGIRKVLGASIERILFLLTKDFLLSILVAMALAWPVSWFLMRQWLQNFAYRIDVDWWIFFLSGLAAILIALITLSFEAIKAAIANPIQSLRTE
jgi:ABC-type antimicrobial peptide transport system permease subunit